MFRVFHLLVLSFQNWFIFHVNLVRFIILKKDLWYVKLNPLRNSKVKSFIYVVSLQQGLT